MYGVSHPLVAYCSEWRVDGERLGCKERTHHVLLTPSDVFTPLRMFVDALHHHRDALHHLVGHHDSPQRLDHFCFAHSVTLHVYSTPRTLSLAVRVVFLFFSFPIWRTTSAPRRREELRGSRALSLFLYVAICT